MSTMATTTVIWPQRILVADIGRCSNGRNHLEERDARSRIQYRCAKHRTAAHVSEGILILRSDQRTNSRLRPKFHSTPLCGHHDAGEVSAEVLLQSGPPWRKLDSEPVSIVAIRPNNSRSQNLSIGSPPHGSLQFGMRQ